MPESKEEQIIKIIAAYQKGAEIECRVIGGDPDWATCKEPAWNFGYYQYRIKPTFDVSITKPYVIQTCIQMGRYTSLYNTILIAQYAIDCSLDSRMMEEARKIVEYK